MEPNWLKQKGAKWWHTDDYNSPNLSKKSMGDFFHTVLSEGASIGDIWVFNTSYKRSVVYVSVFMTEEMKSNIEQKIKVKFREPPKVHLNGT